MGIDRTVTDRPLVGILVPDEDLNYWPAQSTVDEADPYPGEVEADRDTNMTLVASGTPEADETINIVAQSGGLPRHGSASIIWKLSGDASTLYRGWNEPTTLQRSEIPTVVTDTTQGYRYPQMAVLADGSIVMCAAHPKTSSTHARRVSIRIRDSAGSWGAWSDIHTEADPYTAGVQYLTHPSILVLPNGDLELYHYTYEHNATTLQVRKWVSVDDGVTWETAAHQVLVTPIDFSGTPNTNYNRLQVVHHGGQHVMVIGQADLGGGNDALLQYYSTDGGYSFKPVGSSITSASSPQLAVSGGYFVLAYIDTGSNVAEARRIGSAQQALSAATAVTVQGASAATDLIEGLAPDDTGLLYCAVSDSNEVRLTFSDDAGATWSAATRVVLKSAAGQYRRGHCVWWRGQLYYAANQAATAGHGAHAVYLHQFGGYTTLCLPRRYYDSNVTGPFKQTTYTEVYTPHDDVDAVTGATQSGAGGNPTFSTINYANFAGTAAQHRQYLDTGGTTGLGAFGTMVVKVNDAEAHFRLTTGDGAADDWGVEVQVKADGTIDMQDSNTGGSIGSVSTTAGAEVEIFVALRAGTAGNNDGVAAAWYRLTGAAAGGSEDQKIWTAIANTSALTTYVGVGDTARWKATNDGGAYDVDLRRLAWRFETYSDWADSVATPPTNPDDLRGRELSTQPVYVADGVSVRAAGLCHGGDSWTLAARHTYEVQNMLPKREPSPKRQWRSKTGGEQVIAFKLNKDGNDSYLGSDMYGIYLGNVQCHRVKVELRQGGAWVSQGQFDLTVEAKGVNVVGHVLIPRTSGSTATDAPWLNRDEFAGQPFEFYDGVSYGPTRTIGCNYAGTWDAGAIDEHRAALIMSDSDGTEASSVQDCHIWVKNAVIILHLNGSNTAEGVRVTFNPGALFADAPTGDVRCGVLAMGPIQVLGWQPDHTRAIALDLDADELTTHPDGTRTREKRADPHRRVELSWARNSRITSFQGLKYNLAGLDPDYVTGSTDSGAEPVASRYGSPLEFMGLLAERGRRPMVYLPRIPRGSIGNNEFVLTQNYGGGSIYGRFVPGSYRLETVRGAPARDETVRSSVITIEEER